ncbi:uncharacterized protein LACBIDRAFT_327688 [Laccaria bicolor S238N-H82]|uniref:Predicted protein n=1 Tax=Laccaria bicolor (strain S238N-H82 / ATCC MYA-4686) TaxID=486041 RepID=B0DCI9_LACBS|nr:uncharacterized protein LACBIDRAFT_327688 [Laccaria bicolor S238N-H82]EDR07907.1 predicted protein [Laccaria bicolor S238N-H82]|eukprot:XP_001881696.1 predicted protein [Laccaria bicolor S238N-H82]
MAIPSSFHGHSIIIPHGFHVVHGRRKWLGPQPTLIPYGITWGSAPTGKPLCPISGCGQSRIAPDCGRCFRRKHCITKGGCGSKTHTGALSSSAPTCPDLIPVQNLMDHPPQLSGYRPASPLLTEPFSSTVGAGDVPLFPAVPSASPSIDPETLDAWPNPRFNSHMPPIFTAQWKREQEMEVERKRMESERKIHAVQVKHSVTVYAWAEDSKPPAIQDFQEGLFTWPYFPLSPSVLSALSLAGPDIHVQLYRKALGTWVTISPGHIIKLQEHTRVFLKASHVIDYADFDKLLNPESTSAPHLRYNLKGERDELRERYKKASQKGKAPRTEEVVSLEDEDSNDKINKPVAPSRHYFHKQNLAASAFQSASPSTTARSPASDIVEISDNVSSATQQLSRKRKLSRQCSPSAPKCAKSHSASVIELSDDLDSPLPLAIKVEQSSGDAEAPLQWPTDFHAVDIVDFFETCRKNTDIQLKILFHRHFPNNPYHRSTVNENCNRWLKAPQSLCDTFLKTIAASSNVCILPRNQCSSTSDTKFPATLKGWPVLGLVIRQLQLPPNICEVRIIFDELGKLTIIVEENVIRHCSLYTTYNNTGYGFSSEESFPRHYHTTRGDDNLLIALLQLESGLSSLDVDLLDSLMVFVGAGPCVQDHRVRTSNNSTDPSCILMVFTISIMIAQKRSVAVVAGTAQMANCNAVNNYNRDFA